MVLMWQTMKEKELIVVAGGTGLSPVRGVVDYLRNRC